MIAHLSYPCPNSNRPCRASVEGAGARAPTDVGASGAADTLRGGPGGSVAGSSSWARPGQGRLQPATPVAAASATIASMRKSLSLSTKLGAIGGLLLLMALASIGLTLWVTWQLEGGAAAVNEAGRMRMQTWRLAQTLASRRRRAAAGRSWRSSTRAWRCCAAATRRGPLFVPRDDARRSSLRRRAARLAGSCARAGARARRPTAAEAALQAEAFVGRIDAFVTAIETQLSRWTALLNAFQFVMMALAMASAVALLYAAYLFVFNPLARLQAGLARVGEGDLAARVEVGQRRRIRRAVGRLQPHGGDAAGPVPEPGGHACRRRRCGLETERARLAALYEAAAFVATATTLDELAQGFARQVRRVARADASAVRWSDESNQRYLLLASDCLPQARDRRGAVHARRRLLLRPAAGRRAHARHPHPRRRAPAHARPLRARRFRDRGQRAGAPARAHGGRAEPVLPHARRR